VLALTNENKALFSYWYLREPIATRISVCESRGMVESCWSCASRGLMKSTVDTSACLIQKPHYLLLFSDNLRIQNNDKH
jgi:hypothetical protein